MNGRLDDPAWDKAPWTADFVDIEGDKKPKPRFRTRAKMMWDHEFFYIAAEMEEPHVMGTLTEHDSVIFHDNDFEVFIDPDGDAARYFEFEINALNTTWDLYLARAYRDGGSADNSWETYARTATHIQGKINKPEHIDHGWTVEIAFPWDCFRAHGGRDCPPHANDVWRINFSRVEWQLLDDHGTLVNGPTPVVGVGSYHEKPNTPEDNWVWSPQHVVDMHQPEQWGFVHFVV